MHPSSSDRRRFSRVHFHAPAQLSQKQLTTQVEILDLSLKGVLLTHCDLSQFDCQRLLQLTLTLADNATIAMELLFVRGDAATTGFECASIDLDSISHLRRLIELNLGDPAAAERELHELFAA